MAKHIVIQGPVEHDGTVYHEGQELVLPDDQAAPLLLLGVLELLTSKAGKAASDVH